MRIRDWSSDVCSSDLLTVEADSALVQLSLAFQISDAVVGGQQIDVLALPQGADQFVLLPTQCVPVGEAPAPFDAGEAASPLAVADRLHRADQGLRRHTAYIDAGPSDDARAAEGDRGEIGRASCRERVCQYV